MLNNYTGTPGRGYKIYPQVTDSLIINKKYVAQLPDLFIDETLNNVYVYGYKNGFVSYFTIDKKKYLRKPLNVFRAYYKLDIKEYGYNV